MHPIHAKAQATVQNYRDGLISRRDAEQQLADCARYCEAHGIGPAPEPATLEGVTPDDPEPPTSVDSHGNGEGEGAPEGDGPPEWDGAMGPREYLNRYPDGKKAELARAVLASEDDGGGEEG